MEEIYNYVDYYTEYQLKINHVSNSGFTFTVEVLTELTEGDPFYDPRIQVIYNLPTKKQTRIIQVLSLPDGEDITKSLLTKDKLDGYFPSLETQVEIPKLTVNNRSLLKFLAALNPPASSPGLYVNFFLNVMKKYKVRNFLKMLLTFAGPNFMFYFRALHIYPQCQAFNLPAPVDLNTFLNLPLSFNANLDILDLIYPQVETFYSYSYEPLDVTPHKKALVKNLNPKSNENLTMEDEDTLQALKFKKFSQLCSKIGRELDKLGVKQSLPTYLYLANLATKKIPRKDLLTSIILKTKLSSLPTMRLDLLETDWCENLDAILEGLQTGLQTINESPLKFPFTTTEIFYQLEHKNVFLTSTDSGKCYLREYDLTCLYATHPTYKLKHYYKVAAWTDILKFINTNRIQSRLDDFDLLYAVLRALGESNNIFKNPTFKKFYSTTFEEAPDLSRLVKEVFHQEFPHMFDRHGLKKEYKKFQDERYLTLDNVIKSIFLGSLKAAKGMLILALYLGLSNLSSYVSNRKLEVFRFLDPDYSRIYPEDQLHAVALFNRLLPGYFNWKEIVRIIKSVSRKSVLLQPYIDANTANFERKINPDSLSFNYSNDDSNIMYQAKTLFSSDPTFQLPQGLDMIYLLNLYVEKWMNTKFDPQKKSPYKIKITDRAQLRLDAATLANGIDLYKEYIGSTAYMVLSLVDKITNRPKYNVLVNVLEKRICRVWGKFKQLAPVDILADLTNLLPVTLDESYYDKARKESS